MIKLCLATALSVCLTGATWGQTVSSSHAVPTPSEQPETDARDTPSYDLPGRHPSQSKLDALRRRVDPEKRRVGPVTIEKDGVYMPSGVPFDGDVDLDLGYFKAKPSKGFIGLRFRIVPRPGTLDLFGPRKLHKDPKQDR